MKKLLFIPVLMFFFSCSSQETEVKPMVKKEVNADTERGGYNVGEIGPTT